MAFKYITVTFLIAAVQAGTISLQEHHGDLLEPQKHHDPVTYSYPATQVAHVLHVPDIHASHGGYNAHIHGAHAVNHLQKQHSTHEQYADDLHPQYNFSYDVQDAVSGDSKSQSESRDGDVVHGQYSLNDADGFRRIVKYTADSVNGFNAVVEREPLSHKVAVAAAPLHNHHHHASHGYAPADTTYEHPHHEHTHYYHH